MLHLICGRIAAGKSTLAAALGTAPGTMVISEDAWLAAVFPDEMETLRDYVRCAGRLKTAMGPHVVSLLRAEMSVVLDFPANTRADRAWLRDLAEQAGVGCLLHVLDVPEEVCRARMHARNAAGAHAFAPTDEQFDQIAAHFEPPRPDEAFDQIRHGAE